MEFEVYYFRDKADKAPVEDFLIGLRKVNIVLAQKAFKGIEKLRNRFYHKEPLSKHIQPGIWELRVKAGTDILRILYTFDKGQVIILLHAFVKKQQKMPVGELEIARKRLNELRRIES